MPAQTRLTCPVCTRPLVLVAGEDTKAHECLEGDGAFVAGDDRTPFLSPDTADALDRGMATAAMAPRLCPQCSRTMRHVRHDEQAFEACERCRGLWLGAEAFRAVSTTEGHKQAPHP